MARRVGSTRRRRVPNCVEAAAAAFPFLRHFLQKRQRSSTTRLWTTTCTQVTLRRSKPAKRKVESSQCQQADALKQDKAETVMSRFQVL